MSFIFNLFTKVSKSTLATCQCIPLDICGIAKAQPSNNLGWDYGNIIDKLADKNGKLYKEISEMKKDEETES